MKKIICLSFILLCTNIFAVETWLSTNAKYGISFSKGSKITTEQSGKNIEEASKWLTGLGVDISMYNFWNKKNIGLFTQLAFFPSFNYNSKNNIVNFDESNFYNVSKKNRIYSLLFSFGLGLGFRHNISDNFALHYALGGDIQIDISKARDNQVYTSKTSLDNSLSTNNIIRKTINVNFGIITDIGIKYNIGKLFFLNGGLSTSFKFEEYEYIFSDSKFNSSSNNQKPISKTFNQTYKQWVKKYFRVNIEPYIGIGVNI